MRELAVTFRSGEQTLAGTLALPEAPAAAGSTTDDPASGAPARLPAVLLVSGSGQLDRNSDHKKLAFGVSRQLAEALAAHGVASLRYDKRGVGESTGDFLSTGLHDNVDDAAAALQALAGRPEVDPARLFVAGHSEGAVIATVLAGRGVPLAGVVLLSGSAKDGADVLRWQMRAIMPTLPAVVRAVLKVVRVDLTKKQEKQFARFRGTTTDVVRMQGRKINAKWMREFLGYDPRTDLARLDLPVLAVTGSKDLQVDPGDVAEIARIVPGPVQAVVLPDVTHALRVQPGRPSVQAYRKEVREPVERRLLDTVTQWVGARAAAVRR